MTHYFLGLGNPGPKYADTRHNVGFAVINQLASLLRLDSAPSWEVGKRGAFGLFRHSAADCAFCLVKPLTFVNQSGAVLPYLAKIGIPLDQLVVVYDNLDLPLGSIKLKHSGSSGGHNGLRSIIDAIGETFFRIGIGIGRPQYSGQVHNYVLAVPPSEEQALLGEAVSRVCRSYLDYPRQRFIQRMEYLHRRLP